MKILVVDDEPSFAALLSRALRRMGHVVAMASSAAEALSAVTADRYDAVITDVDMPDIDGIQLAIALRERHRHFPIAFCGADESVRDRAARIGPVLPKVWTIATLKEVVVALGQAALPDEPLFDPEHGRPQASSRVPAEWVQAARAAANPLSISPALRPGAPEPLEPPSVPASRAPQGVIDDVADADVEIAPAGDGHVSPRHPMKKIRLSCRSWDQVHRLCEQYGSGKTVLTLRGEYRLSLHEPLVVALGLPDELVLALRAEVIAIRRDDSGGPLFAVGLTGLTQAVVERLEGMVAAACTRSHGRKVVRTVPRAHSEISVA